MERLIPPEPVTFRKVTSAIANGTDRRPNPCCFVINGPTVTINGPDRLHSLFGVNGTLAKCQPADHLTPPPPNTTKKLPRSQWLAVGLGQGKVGTRRHLLNVLLLFTYTSEDKWVRWHFSPSFAFRLRRLQFYFTSGYYSSPMRQVLPLDWTNWIHLLQNFHLVYKDMNCLLHIAS